MVWKVESGVGVVDKLESPSSLIDIIGKYSYQSAKKRFLGWESAITVRQGSHQVSSKFVSRLGMGKDSLSAHKRMIVLKAHARSLRRCQCLASVSAVLA